VPADNGKSKAAAAAAPAAAPKLTGPGSKSGESLMVAEQCRQQQPARCC
jgi:hypothetical protein